jgi:benzodiazapine receptor
MLLVLFPPVVGAMSAFACAGGFKGAWYEGLRRPAWQPPARVFSLVWSVLYVAMGVSLSLAAKAGARVSAFAVQLALCALWPVVFVVARAPAAALVVLLALYAAVLATIRDFAEVSAAAAALLAPYLSWLSVAMALNAEIVFGSVE